MSGHCGKCGHTICICEELAERFTHDATCPCYECITARLAAAEAEIQRLDTVLLNEGAAHGKTQSDLRDCRRLLREFTKPARRWSQTEWLVVIADKDFESAKAAGGV